VSAAAAERGRSAARVGWASWVEAEELADEHDGQDLAVVQQRREAAPADTVQVALGELVIDQAKDGQHIIIQGQGALLYKNRREDCFSRRGTMTY
jgi:hypothetical protein